MLTVCGALVYTVYAVLVAWLFDDRSRRLGTGLSSMFAIIARLPRSRMIRNAEAAEIAEKAGKHVRFSASSALSAFQSNGWLN